MAAFSEPFFAPLFALAADFSARFIFARLIGRIYESFTSGEPGIPARPPNCRTGETPVAPPYYSSTDDPHAAAPAQLFHPAQKIAVRHHIIAFGFHHRHEIALPLHVKEHFRLALALAAKRVQRIDRTVRRVPQRNPYAQR